MLEILFPLDKFLYGRIFSGNPLLRPTYSPQHKEVPLKTSLHFPITHAIYKQWSKVVTCSPSPGDCGELSRLLVTLGKTELGGA